MINFSFMGLLVLSSILVAFVRFYHQAVVILPIVLVSCKVIGIFIAAFGIFAFNNPDPAAWYQAEPR